MSIEVPGHGTVPIRWMGDDIRLSGPEADGEVGRRGQTIKGIVHHRIVGSLSSAILTATRNRDRQVGYSFAIGHLDGRLTIVQFIALQNTPYTQGQNDRDRQACRWQPWVDAGRPLINNMVVSIEHEDGASANRYVVEEDIIAASIALDRLMLSGDGDRIRAAGVRCSDEAAAQLGRLTPNADSLIDHNVCAPITKPYCWRPIGDDNGFPQARYIRELTGDPDLAHPIRLLDSVTSPILAEVIEDTVFRLGPSDSAPENGPAVKGRRYDLIAYPAPGWRGVKVMTGIPYDDKEPRPTMLFLPISAVTTAPKPPESEPDCADEVEAATAPLRAQIVTANQERAAAEAALTKGHEAVVAAQRAHTTSQAALIAAEQATRG